MPIVLDVLKIKMEHNYVHADKEILNTAKEYYSDLYRDKSSKVHEIKMFFDSIVPEKQLSDEMREKCEGECGTSE